jgi:hypothetical protein
MAPLAQHRVAHLCLAVSASRAVVEWNGRPGIRSHGFGVGPPPFGFRSLGDFLAFAHAATGTHGATHQPFSTRPTMIPKLL